MSLRAFPRTIAAALMAAALAAAPPPAFAQSPNPWRGPVGVETAPTPHAKACAVDVHDRCIKTVYVPLFANSAVKTTPNRGIEVELTKAVIHQIQARTPFRVVSNPEQADVELIGRVVSVGKNILNRDPQSKVREAEIVVSVEILWRDRRDGKVLNAPRITDVGRVIPELGEGAEVALKRAVDRLATGIVATVDSFPVRVAYQAHALPPQRTLSVTSFTSSPAQSSYCVLGAKSQPCCAAGAGPQLCCAGEQATKLSGTWYRELPGAVAAFTLAGDELKATLTFASGEAFTTVSLTGHYAVAKDGTVHGVVTGVDVDLNEKTEVVGIEFAALSMELQELVDQPFAFRCRPTDGGVMVNHFRFAGARFGTPEHLPPMAPLAGKYKAAGSEPVPTPKLPKPDQAGRVDCGAPPSCPVVLANPVPAPPHPPAMPGTMHCGPLPAPPPEVHAFMAGVFCDVLNRPRTVGVGRPPEAPDYPACPQYGGTAPPCPMPVGSPVFAGPVPCPAPVTVGTPIPTGPVPCPGPVAVGTVQLPYGVPLPPPPVAPTAYVTMPATVPPAPPAPPVAVSQSASMPNGTWYRNVGDMQFAITLRNGHLTGTAKFSVEEEGKSLRCCVTVCADCYPCREGGRVVGLVTGVDMTLEGESAEHSHDSDLFESLRKVQRALNDKPFAMNFRVYDDVLVIGNVQVASTGEEDMKDSLAEAVTMMSGRYQQNVVPPPGTKVIKRKSTVNMAVPSGRYLEHYPQYFPPDPSFPLPRELAVPVSGTEGVPPMVPPSPPVSSDLPCLPKCISGESVRPMSPPEPLPCPGQSGKCQPEAKGAQLKMIVLEGGDVSNRRLGVSFDFAVPTGRVSESKIPAAKE